MPSLKEVRQRISSVVSTQQITKAMKMVAAAKLRKAQDRMLQMRPYSQKLGGILANVMSSLEDNSGSPYAEKREPEKILIVLITSDRGLCGGFNTNVTRAVNALLLDKYAKQHSQKNVTLMCLGKKGRDFYKRRNYKMDETYAEILHTLNFEHVRKAAESAMNDFLAKKYDVIELVYNEFKNVATQILRVEQFLPLDFKATSANQKLAKANKTDYIFEPDQAEIVSDLIPKSLKIQFYKALLESNASEQGSRMTAMDKATENAGELLKALRLSYNQSRQAAITKEILEIVGGAEALAKG